MTTKEFVAVEKTLLSSLPNFSIQGALLFRRPIKEILCGIAFDRSGDKASFYVWYFAMPACVPSKSLYLNYGRRLIVSPGRDRWEATMPQLSLELASALRLQALPYFTRLGELDTFITYAMSLTKDDMSAQRALAYALARSGKYLEAVAVIDHLRSLTGGTKRQWVRDIVDEALGLRTLLVNEPAKALQQLREWEEETFRNLRLNAYR
jgi:hypothetical protein